MSKTMNCKVCGELTHFSFTNEEMDARLYDRVRMGSKQVKCRFDKKQGRTIEVEDGVICRDCWTLQQNALEAKKRPKLVHKLIKGVKPVFKCPINCGKELDSKALLIVHVNNHAFHDLNEEVENRKQSERRRRIELEVEA
jgi:hypothetical protein